MQDELIKFETAKLAKEKEFPQSWCKAFFDNGKPKSRVSFGLSTPSDYGDRYIGRVTQSLLQRWLREIHEIFVDVSTGSKNEFGVIFGKVDEPDWVRDDQGEVIFYSTYEKALESGIVEALKLIK